MKNSMMLVGTLVAVILFTGQSVAQEVGKKGPSTNLIITPSSVYSTEKARQLARQYRGNLEKLVERLFQAPIGAKLRFENNITSEGGVGFFSHSAAKSPDERYLEVIFGVPEILDEKTDFHSKVNSIFSQYGFELLWILANDIKLYGEPSIAGYGLNVSWRNQAPSSSMTLERAVIYVQKEKALKFLSKQLTAEALLGDATIFGIHNEGEAKLTRFVVSTANTTAPSPILEETLDKSPATAGGKHNGQIASEVPGLASEVAKQPAKVDDKTLPPDGNLVAKKSPSAKASRAMAGYVVQLTFETTRDADFWSARFGQEGHSVWVNTLGREHSVQLRIGGFASFAEAKKLLVELNKQGHQGVVIHAADSLRTEVGPISAAKQASGEH